VRIHGGWPRQFIWNHPGPPTPSGKRAMVTGRPARCGNSTGATAS
jgi:hypothetical protein